MAVASQDELHTHAGFLHQSCNCNRCTACLLSLYTGETPTTISTFIGVGVGVGVFLLLMLSTAVILMLVVVMVKRKASHKSSTDVTISDNNTVVAMPEVEMQEQDVSADCKDARGVDNDQGEEDPFDVGYNPYEVVDRKAHSKNTRTPALKNLTTQAAVPRVDAVYAAVDKSKSNGAKKKTEDEPTVVNKVDLYALPMARKVKMTYKKEGVVVSSGVEETELYDDVVQLTYKTKTNKIP